VVPCEPGRTRRRRRHGVNLNAGNFVAAVAAVAILTALSGPPGRRGLLAGVTIGVQLVGWAVLVAGAPW
jgi:hypothetical protein